jgi:hypothetical protein
MIKLLQQGLFHCPFPYDVLLRNYPEAVIQHHRALTREPWLLNSSAIQELKGNLYRFFSMAIPALALA